MLLYLLACSPTPTEQLPSPTTPPSTLPERFPGTEVFEPAAPTATVVTLHGSEGCDAPYNGFFADALSTRGFRAIAFCWYGGDGQPEQLHNVPLERTVELLDGARELYGSDGPLFLYGVSRGAEHVVLLASLLASDALVDAVAVHAASDTVVAAFDPSTGGPVTGSDGQWAAAWTWEGEPLYGERGLPFGSGPRIRIEDYPGPVYLSHGADDPLWPAARSERLAEARDEAGGLVTELTVWPGQGHVLTDDVALLDEVADFFTRHQPATAPDAG